MLLLLLLLLETGIGITVAAGIPLMAPLLLLACGAVTTNGISTAYVHVHEEANKKQQHQLHDQSIIICFVALTRVSEHQEHLIVLLGYLVVLTRFLTGKSAVSLLLI